MDKPTEIQHYIKIITNDPLDKETVKRWFKVVKDNSPNNILTSIQIEHPNNYLANVAMVHKKTPNTHEYIIPLTRDLLQKEIDKISNNWDTGRIESSIAIINPMYNNIQVDKTDNRYKEMSEEIAKIMHNRWLNNKVNNGWRYGLEYSSDDKVHPLIKPWEQLSKNHRIVDYDLPLELLKIFKKYFP
jgi:hypothetical protein